MFGRRTNEPKMEKAPKASAASRRGFSPSVIAEGMYVLGNIVSDGVLDIDGKIDGNVRGETVTVRPNGAIRGDVVADIVYVHGYVEGLIKAKQVMLYADARVIGTIMHEALKVEDGAFVDGDGRSAEGLLRDLFRRYLETPDSMPAGWRLRAEGLAEPERARLVADFVAGMTDRYAVDEHQRLFDATPDLR